MVQSVDHHTAEFSNSLYPMRAKTLFYGIRMEALQLAEECIGEEGHVTKRIFSGVKHSFDRSILKPLESLACVIESVVCCIINDVLRFSCDSETEEAWYKKNKNFSVLVLLDSIGYCVKSVVLLYLCKKFKVCLCVALAWSIKLGVEGYQKGFTQIQQEDKVKFLPFVMGKEFGSQSSLWFKDILGDLKTSCKKFHEDKEESDEEDTKHSFSLITDHILGDDVEGLTGVDLFKRVEIIADTSSLLQENSVYCGTVVEWLQDDHALVLEEGEGIAGVLAKKPQMMKYLPIGSDEYWKKTKSLLDKMACSYEVDTRFDRWSFLGSKVQDMGTSSATTKMLSKIFAMIDEKIKTATYKEIVALNHVLLHSFLDQKDAEWNLRDAENILREVCRESMRLLLEMIHSDKVKVSNEKKQVYQIIYQFLVHKSIGSFEGMPENVSDDTFIIQCKKLLKKYYIGDVTGDLYAMYVAKFLDISDFSLSNVKKQLHKNLLLVHPDRCSSLDLQKSEEVVVKELGVIFSGFLDRFDELVEN